MLHVHHQGAPHFQGSRVGRAQLLFHLLRGCIRGGGWYVVSQDTGTFFPEILTRPISGRLPCDKHHCLQWEMLRMGLAETRERVETHTLRG